MFLCSSSVEHSDLYINAFPIEQNILDDILRVEHLIKHFIKKSVFRSKVSIVRATDDISFSVKKGEVFVLAGESSDTAFEFS